MVGFRRSIFAVTNSENKINFLLPYIRPFKWCFVWFCRQRLWKYWKKPSRNWRTQILNSLFVLLDEFYRINEVAYAPLHTKKTNTLSWAEQFDEFIVYFKECMFRFQFFRSEQTLNCWIHYTLFLIQYFSLRQCTYVWSKAVHQRLSQYS